MKAAAFFPYERQPVSAHVIGLANASVDMTKGLEREVILSEEVYKTARLPVNLLPGQELSIRGRAEPMVVRLVANARMLSSPRLPIVA
jgi:adenylate cyclase